MLAVYAIFRAVDLSKNHALQYLWMWREETLSFWLEIGLLVVVPLILLSMPKVRNNPQTLYWTCAVVVSGFMANRLNVSITGLQATSGVYYVPKWTEFAATLMVLTVAVLAFRYAVIYLDILPKRQAKLPPQLRWTVRGAAAEA
jgi:Ni/Fe-hydrogenase subunit HybB-like protein